MFYAQVTGQWAPQKLDSFFFWCLSKTSFLFFSFFAGCLSKTDAAGSIVASVSLIVVRLPVSSPVPDELNQLARDYHMQGTVCLIVVRSIACRCS